MNVRLLRGFFLALDGHAINDFQTLADGPVTDLTPGLDAIGGCGWGETLIWQR